MTEQEIEEFEERYKRHRRCQSQIEAIESALDETDTPPGVLYLNATNPSSWQTILCIPSEWKYAELKDAVRPVLQRWLAELKEELAAI